MRVKRGRSPEPFQAASQDLQKKARIDANAEIDLEEVKALLVTQGQILKSAELEFSIILTWDIVTAYCDTFLRLSLAEHV